MSHLFRLRVPQLLIWPLKTSVTSDHCCFVMLHRRPRGSNATQGLPFISARVPSIGPDTNSVTAELHFQVKILVGVVGDISQDSLPVLGCTRVNVRFSRKSTSIQRKSAPPQKPHYSIGSHRFCRAYVYVLRIACSCVGEVRRRKVGGL